MTDIENKIVDRWQVEASNPFKEFQDNNPFVAEIPEVGSLDMEGIHAMLSDMGTLVDPADFLNSILYLLEGESSKAALAGIGAIPVVGSLKFLKKPFEVVRNLFKGVKKASPEEQQKFFKHYMNIIREEKKFYGQMRPGSQHPINIDDAFEFKAESVNYYPTSESYKESVEYVMDNYKKIIGPSDVKFYNKSIDLPHDAQESLEDILLKLDDIVK